jgi:hypothetical protein
VSVIQVLLKVAATLQVSLDELIGEAREACKFYSAESLPIQRRGEAFVRKLLPERIPGVEFDRVEIAPGTRMARNLLNRPASILCPSGSHTKAP